jgi:hypothetical protein
MEAMDDIRRLDGRDGGRFQRFGSQLDWQERSEQETIPAVFLSTRAGQIQQQAECGHQHTESVQGYDHQSHHKLGRATEA